MICEDYILGDFIEFGILICWERIILAINSASFETHIQFVKGHWGRVCSKSFAHRDPGRTLRNTQLHTFHLLRLCYRANFCYEVELTSAKVKSTEWPNTGLLGHIIEHSLTNWTIEGLSHLIIALECIGCAKHRKVRDKFCKPRCGTIDHIDCSLTNSILLGLLGKELARVVDIDLDLSARKSLNFLLENVHCLCMRICWHTD